LQAQPEFSSNIEISGIKKNSSSSAPSVTENDAKNRSEALTSLLFFKLILKITLCCPVNIPRQAYL
jgi:hypothetical protein